MTEMIKVEHIALAELPEAASFTVEAGSMVVIVTPKDEVSASLTRLITGLERPRSGTIFLFGTDIATFSEREMYAARRRVGVAFGSGGLVSNLKVWENLTLPLCYHQHVRSEELEECGVALLNRLGYTEKLMALPGHLTISQKKLIGCARAMLIDPDVILYESPVLGLNAEEKNRFFRIAAEFHKEKTGRVSLFITSNQGVAGALPEAAVINLTHGQIS